MPLSSCKDWLNLSPIDSQTSDEAFETKEDVEAVLMGAYAQLRNSLEYMVVWGELRGTSLATTSKANTALSNIRRWNILPSNSYCDWGTFYKVINQANAVIKYAPSVVSKDASFNQHVMESDVAEAFYLRALAYFYLVRNFKEVPLVLSPYVSDDQSYNIAKSSESEIFNQIISDLDTASVSTKDHFSSTTDNKGRATKWAVYATLADVYLWTGDYDKCLSACDSVSNSGWTALISGLGDDGSTNNWFSIFNPGNSNESIFELQYNYDLGQTNKLTTWFNKSTGFYSLSDYMYQKFEENPGDYRGSGATYYAYNSNLAIWKFLGLAAITSSTNSERGSTAYDQNWIFYRYADIIFMQAEALIMKGSSNYDQATALLNKIRERAQLTGNLTSQSTEIDMLSMLLDEKEREFVGEGKRWYDLLRIARINNYEYLDYMIEQVTSSASAIYSPLIKATLKDVNSHYLPISTSELEANDKLVQNPYYESIE